MVIEIRFFFFEIIIAEQSNQLAYLGFTKIVDMLVKYGASVMGADVLDSNIF